MSRTRQKGNEGGLVDVGSQPHQSAHDSLSRSITVPCRRWRCRPRPSCLLRTYSLHHDDERSTEQHPHHWHSGTATHCARAGGDRRGIRGEPDAPARLAAPPHLLRLAPTSRPGAAAAAVSPVYLPEVDPSNPSLLQAGFPKPPGPGLQHPGGGYRGIYITVPRGKPGNRGNRAVTGGKSNPAYKS
uniref:Uncharacterized protein n=1 Tax=Oryza glumipatula TaxID=40148 RepID=A0A0D9ZNH4_9ORYZ